MIPRIGTTSSTNARQHPCMAGPILYSAFQQIIYHSVAPSTRHTYRSGVTTFQNFCTRYTIAPYPASTTTLQFFCTHLVRIVSYKTIKLYPAGIHLTHLELGHQDPTSNELLRLLIRGIRRLQGESLCQHLSITIDILCTLKQHLRCSNYSLCEQHLLWSAFTLAFYGFLQASEFIGPSLQWSDISL